MKIFIRILLNFTLIFSAIAPAIAEDKWIDLTHDFAPETIYWPTEAPFNLEVLSHGISAGGIFTLPIVLARQNMVAHILMRQSILPKANTVLSKSHYGGLSGKRC